MEEMFNTPIDGELVNLPIDNMLPSYEETLAVVNILSGQEYPDGTFEIGFEEAGEVAEIARSDGDDDWFGNSPDGFAFEAPVGGRGTEPNPDQEQNMIDIQKDLANQIQHKNKLMKMSSPNLDICAQLASRLAYC